MARKFASLIALCSFVALAAIISVPAIAQTAQSVEGRLSVRWGDPKAGKAGGGIDFKLTRDDGVTLPLSVPSADRPKAMYGFGKRVRITGHSAAAAPQALGPAPGPASRTSAAPATAAPLIVDDLTVVEPPKALPAPSAMVSAAALPRVTKRVLFVLLKYKNDSQTPHPPQFYKDLTNPYTPSATYNIPATINAFYNKTSWNQLKWQADVVGVGGLTPTGWLTLPRPRSGYANCGSEQVCVDTDLINSDAMAIVTGMGINVAVYDNINFVLNNDLDCCAWGGNFIYNGKSYGATWEPPWAQETQTYAHEMGHSLGLPHSGWLYFDYDSPWDEMSVGTKAQSLNCGSYNSANSGATETIYCNEPGSGYITAHKDFMSWIPAANKVEINSISTQTITLEANGAPLGANPKMIKICLSGYPCTGASAHYLSVEARVKGYLYERGIPGSGIVIHDVQMDRGPRGTGNSCFWSPDSVWALPIDRTPNDWDGPPACSEGARVYPNYALNNAQYFPGRTYNSNFYGVKVEVLSRNGPLYSVRVTRSK